MTLGFVDILRLAGFDSSLPTKLVRHQDRRYSVQEMRRNDWLELYQSYQSRPVFGEASQVVSFYGLSGTRAGFYGVYKILAYRTRQPGEGPTLKSCDWSKEWDLDAKCFYELERDSRFDDFRDRIIIDWGPGALAWVQDLHRKNKRDRNKPVLEILESGRKLPPFDDYLEFSLTYAQLQDLFQNEEAHRDWRIPLSAVAGVYLILAQQSGDLYIGSAYGADGIWGRWRHYAMSGNGDNAQLRELIKGNSAYPGQFRFSVLQILPKTMTRNEVIRRETLYKAKLGTRAHGLNSN
jgi:hypothetical protein